MSEPVVRYTLTVTITEMTSDKTKRELERKVIAALSKLDGDVDCECMEAELDTD